MFIRLKEILGFIFTFLLTLNWPKFKYVLQPFYTTKQLKTSSKLSANDVNVAKVSSLY